jgi:hypothetical protein
MNSTVVVRANAQAEPSLIVFGHDDAGKPRASWFDVASLSSSFGQIAAVRKDLDAEYEAIITRSDRPSQTRVSSRSAP